MFRSRMLEPITGTRLQLLKRNHAICVPVLIQKHVIWVQLLKLKHADLQVELLHSKSVTNT